MKRISCLVLIFFIRTITFAQVGIGNTTPQATLDISASNITMPLNNDGILIPRVSNFPDIVPTATQDGILIFYTGTAAEGKGFYYWNENIPAWVNITGAKRINDLLDAKSDVDGTQNGSSIFLGIDSGAADDGSDNRNIGVGFQSLNSTSVGSDNVAVGYRSGYVSTGSGNIFLGSEAGNGAIVDNKIFIENTNADQDNALIYGDFGTDASTTGNILRTNSEFQIGNPTGTGYALPTNQGTAKQVLTSNGDGSTLWATVMSNPQYPDGLTGITPVLLLGATLSYTVPAGKNLYITNIYSNNDSFTVAIDGKLIQSKRSNVTLYTSVTNPILASEGEVITRSNVNISINGFLVDAIVEPITQNVTTVSSYTVPAGKILVLLSGQKETLTVNNPLILIVNGSRLFDGYSNTSINSYTSTSFQQPIFLAAGTVLTSINAGIDYNFNGYLIDE